MRYCFQVHITSKLVATLNICTHISDLVAYLSVMNIYENQDNDILQETRELKVMQDFTINSIENYYFR